MVPIRKIMRTIMRSILISLACVMCLSAMAAPPNYFKADWTDALKAAKDAKKPIFIHFSVSWSGSDREMERKVLGNSEVRAALADYVAVGLDCTPPARGEPAPEVKANIERMKSYGGEGTPFFALVTADGDFIYAMGGYCPPDVMVERLGKAKDALRAYQEFQEYAAKADRSSNEYKVRELQFDLRFRLLAKAKTLADDMLKADADGSRGLAGEAKLAQIQLTPIKDGPDKTKQLYEDIKKLDPKNEKGFWERAVGLQAERSYKVSLKSEDMGEYRHKLVAPTLMVEDLLKNAARFDDKRGVYQMALFLYSTQDRLDDALQVVGELLKDAKGDEAKLLTRLQTELKLKKALLGSVAPKPTSMPTSIPTSSPAPKTKPGK